MTKDDFLDALDWELAATADPAGRVNAEELLETVKERLLWLEAIEPRGEPGKETYIAGGISIYMPPEESRK